MGVSWGELIRHTFGKFLDDKATRLGAAVTFYMAFSIVPLLTISVSVASQFFGVEAVHGQLRFELAELVGSDRAELLESMIAAAERTRNDDLPHSLTAALALIFGATGAFIELKSSMNSVWGVELKPELGIWGNIKDSVTSFVMVAIVILLLFLSMILTVCFSGLRDNFHLPIGIQLTEVAVSATVTTLLFAMILKYLPDVTVLWKDVWIGAIATAVMFTIGKFIVGIYLSTIHAGSANGTASTLLGLLLWMYYSSLIFFFGAEFTQVYANSHGRSLQPLSNVQAIRGLGTLDRT